LVGQLVGLVFLSICPLMLQRLLTSCRIGMHVKKLPEVRRASISFKGPVDEKQSIYMIVAAVVIAYGMRGLEESQMF